MEITSGYDRKGLLTAVDLATHFVLALILAGFFHWLTGRWEWSFLVIIGGVFIDIDHFIDYFLYYGLRFDLKSFFAHGYLASGKCYMVFHSLEIVVLMWAFSGRFLWITPVTAGMTVHLLTDYFFSYRSHPLSLFLLYRWRHGFRLDKVFPDKFGEGAE